jgi:hypothetical protein
VIKIPKHIPEYGGLFLLSPLENGKSTKDECGFKSF